MRTSIPGPPKNPGFYWVKWKYSKGDGIGVELFTADGVNGRTVDPTWDILWHIGPLTIPTCTSNISDDIAETIEKLEETKQKLVSLRTYIEQRP